jgi:hypothetical protein
MARSIRPQSLPLEPVGGNSPVELEVVGVVDVEIVEFGVSDVEVTGIEVVVVGSAVVVVGSVVVVVVVVVGVVVVVRAGSTEIAMMNASSSCPPTYGFALLTEPRSA